MERDSQLVFDRNVVEFVTVAAEYCAFIESSENLPCRDFTDTVLKILPLLYIKASMLPMCKADDEEDLETFVTEADYEAVRRMLADKLADKDDYLDVFVQDMVYSDTPIKKNISEDLADIYQNIKDFVEAFRLGANAVMHDAVAVCKENFEMYWGQILVNTMRALHEVKYSDGAADSEGEIEETE